MRISYTFFVYLQQNKNYKHQTRLNVWMKLRVSASFLTER